jgi:hypothetical protein
LPSSISLLWSLTELLGMNSKIWRLLLQVRKVS